MDTEDIVVLRVRGQKFITPIQHLLNYPETRLGGIAREIMNSSPVNGLRDIGNDTYISRKWQQDDSNRSVYEMKFDRDPVIFGMIHSLYLSGHMHLQHGVCIHAVEAEMEYWGVSMDFLAVCCWQQLHNIRDTERNLAKITEEWDKIWFVPASLPQRRDWAVKLIVFFEYPNSSRLAKAFAILTLLVILVSVLVLGLETVDDMRVDINRTEPTNLTTVPYSLPKPELIVLECVALIYLSVFVGLSMAASIGTGHHKRCVTVFALAKILAWISLPASWFVMFYVYVLHNDCKHSSFISTFCQVCSILRLFRTFFLARMARYYRSLAILILALNASKKELMLLGILLIFGAAMFGSLVYYVEPNNHRIPNIPYGYWWALITMTTVGYGDVYPNSTMGYLVGSACAVTGILIIALPVPVISQNFTMYYTCIRQIDRARQREKKNKEKERKMAKAQKIKDELPVFRNVTRSPIGWNDGVNKVFSSDCSPPDPDPDHDTGAYYYRP